MAIKKTTTKKEPKAKKKLTAKKKVAPKKACKKAPCAHNISGTMRPMGRGPKPAAKK